MTERDISLSKTEQTLQEFFKDHPQRRLHWRMCRQLQEQLRAWDASGIDPTLQAWALQTTTVAMLSAQKQARVADPRLYDLMADDLVDAVKGRAYPGVPTWLTPQ